jgi:hypothetical protein
MRVTYWEGSVAVRGSMQGQAQEGVGYVDLTGYVQQVNLSPYLGGAPTGIPKGQSWFGEYMSVILLPHECAHTYADHAAV